MRRAVAPSTRSAYEQAGWELGAFRVLRGLEDIWPIPIDHLLEYCVSLHHKGLAVGTLRAKLAGLAFEAKINGFPDTTTDFRVRKMLEGWARSNPPVQDKRKPITPEMLLGLLRQWAKLCSSNYEQCLFHATALVTFFFFFLISEVVAASKADKAGRCLMWDDLQFEDNGIRLRLRKSKTDQAGRGAWVALAPASREELCPIAAMRSYLKLQGNQQGFLFQHANGSPLTKYQFWAVASKALQAMGLGEYQFGTHSFRIGAASTAAAAGIGETRIKTIGRW